MNHSHKRPVNLKASDALNDEAKHLGINMSADFESALDAAVREARIGKWRPANHAAFADHDRRVEAKGMFSDGKRLF